MSLTNTVVGIAIVILLVLVWALAQGVGESVGHGLREWMP